MNEADDNNINITEKDRAVLKRILALEKVNNKIKKYSNSEMVNQIVDVIKKGVEDEV
jgi:hypothetical protein